MTGKPKILIVEDEPAVLLLMVYLLTCAGCEVLTARTGNEGMRLAQNGDLDLVALDIDLPEMSGFEICRRLKQDPGSRHLPVVFVSGRTCEEDRRRGLELGAADYIEKPFGASVFVRRIFSHIRAAPRFKTATSPPHEHDSSA
jgi:DNA-binding response OmpR family regulator